MHFNENEYCIEMSAEELCALVSRPSDLDSRSINKMNIESRGFDVYLAQLPDYDRAHEPLRAQYEMSNTTQINGTYYTVSAKAHRAYKNGDMGFVDRFVERKFTDECAFPDNYDIALLKTHAYFYAGKHSLERVNLRVIFCFGDGKNDISIFNVADEGYAVANAEPELIEIATAVIGGNNEDGVARWLEQHKG